MCKDMMIPETPFGIFLVLNLKYYRFWEEISMDFMSDLGILLEEELELLNQLLKIMVKIE
jgi:hypothetical protein